MDVSLYHDVKDDPQENDGGTAADGSNRGADTTKESKGSKDDTRLEEEEEKEKAKADADVDADVDEIPEYDLGYDDVYRGDLDAMSGRNTWICSVVLPKAAERIRRRRWRCSR